MQEPFSDRVVITLLLLTLMIVFILIFSTRPQSIQDQPSIQWRETSQQTFEGIKL